MALQVHYTHILGIEVERAGATHRVVWKELQEGGEARREARRWLCWGQEAVALGCFGGSFLTEPYHTFPLETGTLSLLWYVTLIEMNLDISSHSLAHTRPVLCPDRKLSVFQFPYL